ncbi:1617_t:CDS:2 [Cetraspora pellucida]|uniref:1617_t:CDS:1 n=1 Tax=Cetraspora pellucida TaxID=1433469 RepID=A0A9N9BFB8_9GLOM|nr:1617_t:CDS:2 [Cetraspora pellucida]
MTCRVLILISGAFASFHRTFIASVSVITYFRVCRNKRIDTGRYDWKLLLPIAIASFATTGLGWKSYGAVKYWCDLKTDNLGMSICSVSITLSVLFICLFCYLKTIFAIRSVKRKQSLFNNDVIYKNIPHFNEIEIKVTKKIFGYVLVFILQWIPTVPYELWQVYSDPPAWIFCMVAVGLNMGGIGNAIFYVINEGWNRCGNNSNNSSVGKSTDKINISSEVDKQFIDVIF